MKKKCRKIDCGHTVDNMKSFIAFDGCGGALLENELGFEYASDSSMGVSKPNANLCQASSPSLALVVLRKRHWLVYLREGTELSPDLSSSVSSGSGPALSSTKPEYSNP